MNNKNTIEFRGSTLQLRFEAEQSSKQSRYGELQVWLNGVELFRQETGDFILCVADFLGFLTVGPDVFLPRSPVDDLDIFLRKNVEFEPLSLGYLTDTVEIASYKMGDTLLVVWRPLLRIVGDQQFEYGEWNAERISRGEVEAAEQLLREKSDEIGWPGDKKTNNGSTGVADKD